jgi:hypothetical protein
MDSIETQSERITAVTSAQLPTDSVRAYTSQAVASGELKQYWPLYGKRNELYGVFTAYAVSSKVYPALFYPHAASDAQTDAEANAFTSVQVIALVPTEETNSSVQIFVQLWHASNNLLLHTMPSTSFSHNVSIPRSGKGQYMAKAFVQTSGVTTIDAAIEQLERQIVTSRLASQLKEEIEAYTFALQQEAEAWILREMLYRGMQQQRRSQALELYAKTVRVQQQLDEARQLAVDIVKHAAGDNFVRATATPLSYTEACVPGVSAANDVPRRFYLDWNFGQRTTGTSALPPGVFLPIRIMSYVHVQPFSEISALLPAHDDTYSTFISKLRDCHGLKDTPHAGDIVMSMRSNSRQVLERTCQYAVNSLFCDASKYRRVAATNALLAPAQTPGLVSTAPRDLPVEKIHDSVSATSVATTSPADMQRTLEDVSVAMFREKLEQYMQAVQPFVEEAVNATRFSEENLMLLVKEWQTLTRMRQSTDLLF